ELAIGLLQLRLPFITRTILRADLVFAKFYSSKETNITLSAVFCPQFVEGDCCLALFKKLIGYYS
ncbi:hypothetical protein ACFLVL_01995, partial [Chloroflexota bacterium]